MRWKATSKEGGEPAKAAGKTVALVGGTGGAIAAILLFLNQVKDLFKSPASLEKATHLFSRQSYAAKLPLIHEVTRDFGSLVSAYAGGESVYVFIDDLDRCEYTKAAELMQALLMLLSSAPKIALIVGLDRDKVAAAMAAKQEKLLPYLYKIPPAEIYSLGMTYGQRFLEKFIQIAYILPAPRLDGLKAMINPNAKAPVTQVPESEKRPETVEIITGEDDSETLNRMIEMADQVFDHNPRNVKQFINMFRLQAFIANETGLFGSSRVIRKSQADILYPSTSNNAALTLPQLGKYVALCLRWPAFVEDAAGDPGLVGEGLNYLSGSMRDAFIARLKPYNDYRNLGILILFGLPDPDFSLAQVDLRALAEVTPARVRSTDDTPPPPFPETEEFDSSNVPQSFAQAQQTVEEPGAYQHAVSQGFSKPVSPPAPSSKSRPPARPRPSASSMKK